MADSKRAKNLATLVDRSSAYALGEALDLVVLEEGADVFGWGVGHPAPDPYRLETGGRDAGQYVLDVIRNDLFERHVLRVALRWPLRDTPVTRNR